MYDKINQKVFICERSEEYDKRKEDFNVAWNHHQKNNPHHWQYWILTNSDGSTKVLDMPYENIIEMMLAGATAVGVGAANLVNPYACRDIINELPNAMEKYKINSLSEIIGGCK